ncbi:MAG TPA: hypothetical protein VFU98_03385 [Microlunatus sp.]|nr:hypothetical protein [Microlunatus sp.]
MPVTPSRPLRRLGLVLAAGLAVAGLSACSSDSATAEDAYKIGCPALDAAVAGGSVANQAAIKGLQAILDTGQLDAEPQRWVNAAISALESGAVEDMPAEARTLLVDGCADHGYPLKNLK